MINQNIMSLEDFNLYMDSGLASAAKKLYPEEFSIEETDALKKAIDWLMDNF